MLMTNCYRSCTEKFRTRGWFPMGLMSHTMTACAWVNALCLRDWRKNSGIYFILVCFHTHLMPWQLSYCSIKFILECGKFIQIAVCCWWGVSRLNGCLKLQNEIRELSSLVKLRMFGLIWLLQV